MAKLTISEAAALTQVNRSTLHRAMKQGRLSRDTDGRLDTAELLRAGFQLHAPTPPARATAQRVALPQGRATTQRDATLPPSVAQQAGITASHIEITALQRECALLQQQLDATRTMLQQQLDATRELLQSERQEAQDRERRAADREALLLQMLHEAQLRADRLLEAPRPAPPAPPAAPEVVRELLRRRPYADLPAPGPIQDPNRHARRQRILEVLAAYPEGLHWREIGRLIGDSGDLNDTLQGMLRYKLVRRVGRGVYALPVIG